MTIEELRLEIAGVLRDEHDLAVDVQGKRLVVDIGDELAIILVTSVTREKLLREMQRRTSGASGGVTG